MNDENLSESLRRLPETGASDGFTAAVLRRVAAETADEGDTGTDSPSGSPSGWWAPLPRFAAVATAVVAAVLVTALLTMPGGTPTTPTTPDPAIPVDTVAQAPVTDPAMAESVAESPGESEAGPEVGPEAGSAIPAPDNRTAAGTGTPSAGAGTGLTSEERRRAIERLRELRRQQERLRGRLAALTDDPPAPTLILGGDESVELVLDLTADGGPRGGALDPRPATYRPANNDSYDF